MNHQQKKLMLLGVIIIALLVPISLGVMLFQQMAPELPKAAPKQEVVTTGSKGRYYKHKATPREEKEKAAFDPFADSRRLEGMQGIPDTYKVYGSLGEDYTVAVDANTGDILVYDALNQTGVNTTSVEGKQLIQELSDLNRVAITMSPEEQENLASYTQATVAAMMGTGDVGDMLDARSQFGLSNGPGTAVAGASSKSTVSAAPKSCA